MRTNTVPSAIRIIGHPFCFLREIPIATNNIPSSIDAIIAKNPILFTPFKMDYSIMTICYVQIMSYSNDSGVKLFVHVKKQGYNSFSVFHIQGCRGCCQVSTNEICYLCTKFFVKYQLLNYALYTKPRKTAALRGLLFPSHHLSSSFSLSQVISWPVSLWYRSLIACST